jgi:hypothetical protein
MKIKFTYGYSDLDVLPMCEFSALFPEPNGREVPRNPLSIHLRPGSIIGVGHEVFG